MKQLFLFLLMAFSGFAALSQAPGEVLELKQTAFDFGKIPQGKPVFHMFELVNAGKDSLHISNVQASCGCTTPEWDHGGIAPGAVSVIKVGYNAAAEGSFTKTVTVTANGQQKIIVISGTVFQAPATSAPLNTSVSLLKNSN
jgi:hypothetical protein